MRYYFKPSALRDLKRLPKILQKRIVKKLDFYTKTANPLNFAEPLKDKAFGEYRFRVGDYRIIFDVADNKIVVLTLGHRKDIYK